MPAERLQKILAHAGIASRRAAEELILAGRVRVNGRIVRELGARADSHKDRIQVDGRRVVLEKPAYYVLHKPRETVSTLKDPEGRQTIADFVKRLPERVYPIGRLDYHTTGVLLLTNDGEMSEALTRPDARVPKVYAARMQGHLDEDALEALRKGVELDDGYKTKPAEVFVLREEERSTWVQLTLEEGKNRQVHRMGEAVGHRVQRLVRTSFAGITADGLRPGQMRPLTDKEVDKLKKKYLNPQKKKKRESAGRGASGGRGA